MSAPILWIGIPFFLGLVLLVLTQYRQVVYYAGILVALMITTTTYFLPIDQAIVIGPISFKLDPIFTILGRRLVLDPEDQTILILLYLIVLFWLIGGLITRASVLLPTAALMMTSLLTASLAVEPFLYAAVLIAGAVLVSIPLFPIPPDRKNPGVVRYLTFQMIGLPFMLLTGWFLGSLQTGAADPQDVLVALIFLGLGFGFTLAIFPLYSWIPMMADEEDPYTAGFVFSLLPVAVLLSLLTYVNQYTWLRESLDLPRIFQTAAVMMIVTGGIWSAFQRDLARMFGYAVLVENGMAVLCVGLMTMRGYHLFANLFLSRVISFGLWALCLSLVKKELGTLKLVDIAGLGRRFPLLTVGILAAQFSIGGLPLLAGFPLQTAIVEELASQSAPLAWMLLVGIAGLWAGGIYSLYVLLKGHQPMERIWLRNRLANVAIILGFLALVFLGLFPQLPAEFLNGLVLPFHNLTGI
jgi:NADH:ubiquinone oxidoreductase subunit 2 (subunit N)